MDMLYRFSELFATFAEGFIVLSVMGSLCGRKHSKRKHISLILVFTVIYTALITYMNTLQAFSFLTITVAVLYSFAVLFVTSDSNFLIKAASTMLAWFFSHALDYISVYIGIMIIGKTLDLSQGLDSFMTPGPFRLFFLYFIKPLQAGFFYSFRKMYLKFRYLDRKSILSLFVLSTVSFILIQGLTALILTDSVVTLQIAVVLSLIFIVFSLISVITAIYINSKYQKEKRESELMSLSNTMMEKNFSELEGSQNAIRQQIHDFKNHIRTINGMIDSNIEAKKYIEELLSESYKQANHCHCINNVINSIINCKLTEAEYRNIPFKHSISLSSELHIAASDICAILANQIDNALEACVKIPSEEERFVKVEIWQKESFVFFKVTNTVLENPFNSKHELISTKTDENGLHGFGIKNITRTVSSYGGTLKNDYKDGIFVSVAMVPNNG